MPFMPSVTALRCLDASAQSGSFTRAALRLNLTQSAVSHHILNLEHHLGVKLFDRAGSRLQLTEPGMKYWKETAPALEQLQRATLHIASKRDRASLTIVVPPSLTQTWLMQRACNFVDNNRDITLNLVNHVGNPMVDQGEADAAIELSDGNSSGVESVRLLSLVYRPYASVKLLRRLGPDEAFMRYPLSLDALMRVFKSAALIRTSMAGAWEGWLRLAALNDQVDPACWANGPVYSQASLALIAVLNGTGVAMLPKHVVNDHIAAGTLSQLSDIGWPANRAYHLQWSTSRPVSPSLRRFVDWASSIADSE